ncbi:hypothetical protein HEK616_79640 (plasmid) [Streptomyces nigrescens]|uniref:Uncharacterized protein n=1 Tax=Streptomyces nigrescens TaxID=1920 RepID=A0ABM8A772_STRNI|nr:hypothetical protein HEK616_79640 [Streptomyces nigrescens]
MPGCGFVRGTEQRFDLQRLPIRACDARNHVETTTWLVTKPPAGYLAPHVRDDVRTATVSIRAVGGCLERHSDRALRVANRATSHAPVQGPWTPRGDGPHRTNIVCNAHFMQGDS